MNWKPTLAFAILFAALAGIYLAWSPSPNGKQPELPRLFAGVTRDQVSRLEIVRPGRPEIIIERKADPSLGLQFRLVQPLDRPANDTVVLDMVMAIVQLTRSGGIRPGDAAYDLAGLGLDAPPLTVTVHHGTTRRLIRFGTRSTIDTSLRYFQVDADPVIYLGLDSIAAAFEKDLFQIRNRRPALYRVDRMVRFEVESRYEQRFPVIDASGKQTGLETRVLYDRSKMALMEERPGRPAGWHLVQVNDRQVDERVDDLRVMDGANFLWAIYCQDFVASAPPAEFGLDLPDVRYRIWLKDAAKPVTIALADRVIAEGPEAGKRRVAIQVEGDSEIGLVKVEDYDRLLRARNDYKRTSLFDVAPAQLKSLRIVNSIGSLELASAVPAGDPPPPAQWSVAAPLMRALPPEELERVVGQLLDLQILEFLPMQEDLKIFGLAPPVVTVTLAVARGEGKTEALEWRFGWLAGEDAYALKPGGDEICRISADRFHQLDRVDLLARHKELLSIPRGDLREIAAEFKSTDVFAPVFYMVRRNDAGAWEFVNTELKGQEVDERQMDLLIASVCYLEAESYVTRRPERAKGEGIVGPRPPARITLKYLREGALKELCLNLSEPHMPASGAGAIYYAKFEPTGVGERPDDPFFQVVFRPKASMVELARRGVKKRKAVDEGTDPVPTPTPPK